MILEPASIYVCMCVKHTHVYSRLEERTRMYICNVCRVCTPRSSYMYPRCALQPYICVRPPCIYLCVLVRSSDLLPLRQSSCQLIGAVVCMTPRNKCSGAQGAESTSVRGLPLMVSVPASGHPPVPTGTHRYQSWAHRAVSRR